MRGLIRFPTGLYLYVGSPFQALARSKFETLHSMPTWNSTIPAPHLTPRLHRLTSNLQRFFTSHAQLAAAQAGQSSSVKCNTMYMSVFNDDTCSWVRIAVAIAVEKRLRIHHCIGRRYHNTHHLRMSSVECSRVHRVQKYNRVWHAHFICPRYISVCVA